MESTLDQLELFDQLKQSVAKFYGVSFCGLGPKNHSSLPYLIRARRILVYLARTKLQMPFFEITELLSWRQGNMYAIHAYNNIKEGIAKEENLKKEIDNIPTPILRYSIPNFIADPPLKPRKQREYYLNEILKKYETGKTLKEIGEEYGLTRERIRQIKNKAIVQLIDQITNNGITINVKQFVQKEEEKHLLAKRSH